MKHRQLPQAACRERLTGVLLPVVVTKIGEETARHGT